MKWLYLAMGLSAWSLCSATTNDWHFSGRVIDPINREGVSSVFVMVEDTFKTVTDAEGNYELYRENGNTNNFMITFMRDGYSIRELDVSYEVPLPESVGETIAISNESWVEKAMIGEALASYSFEKKQGKETLQFLRANNIPLSTQYYYLQELEKKGDKVDQYLTKVEFSNYKKVDVEAIKDVEYAVHQGVKKPEKMPSFKSATDKLPEDVAVKILDSELERSGVKLQKDQKLRDALDNQAWDIKRETRGPIK